MKPNLVNIHVETVKGGYVVTFETDIGTDKELAVTRRKLLRCINEFLDSAEEGAEPVSVQS